MKNAVCFLIASVILCSFLMTACDNNPGGASADTASAVETDPQKVDPTVTDTAFDPYSIENKYDVEKDMFSKQEGVDYGTLLKDVSYFSTVAGDDKQVNIVLPAGYDGEKTYPVTYIFHGFGGSHNTHINTDSYLVLLYGNLLSKGLAEPQILVGMDMYTDKLSEKDGKTDEELRFIYDKAIEETAVDLMPFIESNYPVKKGRENTAVAGMSEGGAKSLCTGFKWLDKFGYIGAFAPDTGVIPTEYFKGTFWNVPVFDEFPKPSAENTPYYLYMAVGTKDPWNIDCTLYYRDVLNEMNIKNQTDIVDGYAHDSEFWGQCFYNFLTKLYK